MPKEYIAYCTQAYYYPPPDYTSHLCSLPTSRLYISPRLPPTHLQTIHLTHTPYPPPDYTSHPPPLPTSRLYISPSPPTHLQTISHPHPLPTSRLYISPSPPTHLQTIHLTLIPYPPPDYTSHSHPPTHLQTIHHTLTPLPTSRLYTSSWNVQCNWL